jgi:hypothetical protein
MYDYVIYVMFYASPESSILHKHQMVTNVLQRLSNDLSERNITYGIIGGAAVWLLTGGNGRDVADIDVLVSADVDVAKLRENLVVECADGWYGMVAMNLFCGMTDTDPSGILIISLLTNSI